MLASEFKPVAQQKRQQLPFHIGSSDALTLARLARENRPLAIFTETALHGQRLFEEIKYFDPELRVYFFPDWETLPYDHFSPHQDLVSERLATLYELGRGAFDVVIIPVTTALYRLAPASFLAAYTFFLKQGDRLDLQALRTQCALAGYTHVTQVVSPGEFSIRGGLIDLFPMGSPLPYRIDLFDDEIETMRTFDVDNQRSIYPVKELRLLPAREFPFSEDGITRFRQNFRDTFEGDPSKSTIYKDVSQGIATPGIEYYLPLFFETTATIFDYLPAQATLCLHHDVAAAVEAFLKDAEARYQLLRGDRERPLLPPRGLFLTADQFYGLAKPYPRVELPATPEAISEAPTRLLPAVHVDRRADNPLAHLVSFLNDFDGRVLLLAESLGRRETIGELLAGHGLHPLQAESWAAFVGAESPLMLGVGPVSNGFISQSYRFAIISESELYAIQVRPARTRESSRKSSEWMLRDLSEVRIGDPVVHEQHGIGRYRGLVNLDLGEGETEFLLLEYAGNDKLYVPVSSLHLISRYSGGAAEAAPLHRLGSGQWEKAKRRASEAVRDVAAELLNIYAQRAARKGHAFDIKQHEYDIFAAAFPFEETPDQAAAINAVIEDMRAGKPMDRLICGDVGFGKTEVALRAAFLAVMGGKQVAILVPTTLLAEQHFQNFSDRFGEWPIRVAEMSRFRSAKELAAALKGLAEGTLDLVIGTHKLLQKDVKFKNLGLVIIDEEHRFGVRQKDQLKALRAEVDVLTLTATPIPRTLAMSLEGLRDFSVITTAPQRRLAIKTFVNNYSTGIIREAVLRELKRGGQVYFLHNEVDTIALMQQKLTALLPEARIAVAHGQMRERDLEHVMRDFYQQRFNVLLCTTIIETGIDIPTANTIVINKAERFGLAQLHQLRGRVGRSHHQAYAYLLTHSEDSLTAQAKKRLEAIQMMEDLGAGFYLAMHDLEIRGAGELLGESQSGEMQEIGFTLYAELLNSAVKSLQAGQEPDSAQPFEATTEINLHSPALLPADYCNDVHERLVIYKRLASCDTLEALDGVHEELIDRFGLLPPSATTLLETHRLRIRSREFGIVKIDASADSVQLQFVPNPPIDAQKILTLIQTRRHYKLKGPDRLLAQIASADVPARIIAVKQVLADLSA